MNKVIFFGLVLLLAACASAPDEKAQQIINQSIKAHGGSGFMNRTVQFTFRNIEYTATRNKSGYTYTRSFSDSTNQITDRLVNSVDFTRMINGSSVSVPDSMAVRYTNSINSVLYFIQLPYLLNDPAVIKQYQGSCIIKGESYHQVRVTFQPEGGGVDFEDEYLYWFHSEDFTMDYLAYSYHTEGGGIRFREAYNRVERGGILFQDYVNYEVPKGTPFSNIPPLFEKRQLKELSRIVNEEITVRDLQP